MTDPPRSATGRDSDAPRQVAAAGCCRARRPHDWRFPNCPSRALEQRREQQQQQRRSGASCPAHPVCTARCASSAAVPASSSVDAPHLRLGAPARQQQRHEACRHRVPPKDQARSEALQTALADDDTRRHRRGAAPGGARSRGAAVRKGTPRPCHCVAGRKDTSDPPLLASYG